MDLSIFKNIHKGKRGFLLASGPSLSYTNLHLILNDDIIFSVGLAFKANISYIDHHFVGDMNIVNQFKDDFMTLKIANLFVSQGIYDSKILKKRPLYYFRGHGERKFHRDVTKRIYGGGTATFLGMQFAYYMGIQELYLIGLDHSWNLNNSEKMGKFTKGGNEILKIKTKDTNHFSEDYFKKGTIWHTPDINKMEESYLMARKTYEEDNRILLNATLKTELSEDIIERVDYYSLF